MEFIAIRDGNNGNIRKLSEAEVLAWAEETIKFLETHPFCDYQLLVLNENEERISLRESA